MCAPYPPRAANLSLSRRYPSTGLRNRLPPFNSEQGGYYAFVLAAPDASLRSSLSGFNSRQRLSLKSRWLRVRGGPHKADREGSNPSVATIEVWLNLVRAPRSGRGDCRFESGHLDHLSNEIRGASQLETAPGLHPGLAWVRFPGPVPPRTTRSGRSAASYKRQRRGFDSPVVHSTLTTIGVGRYGLPGLSDKESDPCSTHGYPTTRSALSGRAPARQAGRGGFDSHAPHWAQMAERHTRRS